MGLEYRYSNGRVRSFFREYWSPRASLSLMPFCLIDNRTNSRSFQGPVANVVILHQVKTSPAKDVAKTSKTANIVEVNRGGISVQLSTDSWIIVGPKVDRI